MQAMKNRIIKRTIRMRLKEEFEVINMKECNDFEKMWILLNCVNNNSVLQKTREEDLLSS